MLFCAGAFAGTMRHGLWLVLVLLLGASLAAAQQSDRHIARVKLDDRGCPAGPNRFCIRPSSVQVDEGEKLVLEVTNAGRVEHNLTAAPGTPETLAEHLHVDRLAPNGTATVRIPWANMSAAREQAGSRNLTLQCGFPGHAALGETLILSIGPAETQQPQPGFGALAAVAGVAVAALLVQRRT